ncbi:hypothetical protein MIZ03_0758 [Rhodoferax lithotrophicus]|uniref:Uncharacterized protein n=1 Tax=Rhodoferax lithotrophicus TaxID=2798804 RepID=A0ABM7MI85_9BURK|nr:hypothetical protein MIZ03_0758 [Rhodoferax sp. MIZ03]
MDQQTRVVPKGHQVNTQQVLAEGIIATGTRLAWWPFETAPAKV